MLYVICKMFVSVDLKLSTLLASVFCFYFVLNSCFVLHLCCWIWQSSNVGWAWLSDCFGRLSPNLCCLSYALLIEMCSIAVYLQRKHDLTWLYGFSKTYGWNRKKRFSCSEGGSLGDRHKWRCFRSFGQLWRALGPNLLIHSFDSKFYWKLGQNPHLQSPCLTC